MRVDVVAIGSRGDVQPYIALGLGLRAAGHRVRLVTLDGFAPMVRRHGLEHLAIGDDPRQIASTGAGQDWIERRKSTSGFLRGFVRVAASLIESGIARYWDASRDVDAMVVSPMGLLVGAHVAERLRVPLIRSQLAPRHDWEGRADLAAALRSGWGTMLGASFGLLIWSQLRGVTNVARRKVLGLAPLDALQGFRALDRLGVPLLDAYSAAVVPPPPQWPAWIHVTGYWFLDEMAEWAPPAELVAFLTDGAPPVFVGFGSTPFPQPEATTDLVLGALADAGRRGIVVAGGSGLPVGRLSPDVLGIESVPYDWLFPQVSAVVHHGGAGVTATALRAGRAAVVIPVFGDQPFWAQRVFALGAGPRPIPAARLTREALAAAIRVAAGDEGMHRSAATLGARIRAEDGIGRALEAIHAHIGTPRPASVGAT